jgi:subtilase family serine protease
VGAVVVAHPFIHEFGSLPTPPTTADCLVIFGFHCYQPGQLETAYGLRDLHQDGIDGRGKTILIVDSFGSPTIANDLKVFDKTFGIPDPPSLTIRQDAGPVPPFDVNNGDMTGWAAETTLDVEWSHVFAPGARIVVEETPVSETEGVQGFPEIVKAENYAINHGLGDVISQSFGATEETFPSPESILALRSANINAASEGVSVLAASGDFGSTDFEKNLKTLYQEQVVDWPSADPLVTSIGGTQLHLDEAGKRTAPDNVWNDIAVGIDAAGGGGPSHVFARPEFQREVRTGSGPARATPDISMSAAVNGGVLVYTSYVSTVPGEPEPNTFSIVGGTSEATPLFSGVVALADQVAGHSLGWLNPRLYALSQKPNNGIVDITKGNNTFTFTEGTPEFTVPGFAAHAGYDMASGLGTVDARRFAHARAAG